MNGHQLFTAVRKQGGAFGRFMIAEHDGQLWATNSYWLVKAEPFAPMLAAYNLPLEPMTCDVGKTLVRDERKPPIVGGIVTVANLKKLPPVAPAQIGGGPILSGENGALKALWRTPDDGRVWVNHDYMTFLSSAFPVDEWRSQGPIPPLVGVVDGKVAALLMPIRGATESLVAFDEVAA